MTEPCRRDCSSFRGWTIEHYHATDRPSIVVFHTPEQPGVLATMHEAWGTDACGETAVFPTAIEAVRHAKLRYGATVTLAEEGPLPDLT